MTYYRQYQPGARLSPFVECYWVCRSSGSEGREERLIPGGRVEMIFHLGTSFHWLIHPEAPQGELVSQVQFMGQRDRVYFGRCPGHTEMLGVRWKPGGLAALTKAPLSGFLNKMVPAEAVLGGRLKGWEDRLQEQEDDLTRVALLEQLLTGLIGNGENRRGEPGAPEVLQAAVGMIRVRPDELSVQAICQQEYCLYAM